MEGSDLDVLGPVDYLVVEFPAAKANFSGEMAAQLGSLVDRELIRVLDLLVLRKELDGSVEVAELNELSAIDVGEMLELEADLAMLLAEEDVEAIGAALEPGSVAAVLVYENSWAGPFASVRAPVGWPAGRQRPHPHPGAARSGRSGRTSRRGRNLRCHWREHAEAGPA